MFRDHKGAYYVAIVLNMVLRTAWIVSVIPSSVFASAHMATTSYSFVDMVYPFLAILEQVRRTLWGVFKLEHEHLKAAEKTRFSSLLRRLKSAPADGTGSAKPTPTSSPRLGDRKTLVVPDLRTRLKDIAQRRRKTEYISYSLHDTNISTANALEPYFEASQYNMTAAIIHCIVGVLLVGGVASCLVLL